MNLYNYLFNYVLLTCKKYKIDESHALKHSMDVFYMANQILDVEILRRPELEQFRTILDVSAILHDMCDKKYMTQQDGMEEIEEYMRDVITPEELDISLKIMSTMSYSTIKKNGFPSLGAYQDIYNCVREADLLASYDFDRCILYDMYKNNNKYEDSFLLAKNLFHARMFQYIPEELFMTEYGKLHAPRLEADAKFRIHALERILVRKIKN